VRLLDGAVIGICQAFSALFHGLSRSGNTISVGLFRGLSRKAAAEFSFLVSIPTILAAAVAENVHLFRHDPGALSAGGSIGAYFAGMVAAGLVGYFAISVLLKIIVSMKLQSFIVYCALLGTLLLFSSSIPAFR
jgi:undecaprenyl-diphosphatase